MKRSAGRVDLLTLLTLLTCRALGEADDEAGGAGGGVTGEAPAPAAQQGAKDDDGAQGAAGAGSPGGGEDNGTDGGKAAPTAQALYDADADQVLAFKTERRVRVSGRVQTVNVVVRHTLKPLDDLSYIVYDKDRDVRVASVTGGMDTKSKLLDASEKLYDRLYVGHTPALIKLDAGLKMGVVQEGLLVTALVPPVTLSDEEVERLIESGAFVEDGRNTITLRCLFNSTEVSTEHDLDAPNAEQQRRYTQLVTRAKLVDGERVGQRETQMPSRASALGKLYDELIVEARGYKGRVPLHHKIEVITQHLSTEQEIVEGN